LILAPGPHSLPVFSAVIINSIDKKVVTVVDVFSKAALNTDSNVSSSTPFPRSHLDKLKTITAN
jgi:hypothetical protein